jgi:uncharacterized protein YigE (DUF2233 family)
MRAPIKSPIKSIVLPLLAVLAACHQDAKKDDGVVRIEFGKDNTASESSPGASSAGSSVCVQEEFEGAAMTHCVADPDRHRVTTALGPKSGGVYRSFAALKRSVVTEDVAFAVNAGMFDGEGRPIGYYVEDANRLKTLNRANGPGNFHLKPNGVFFGTGGKWRVMDSDTFVAKVVDRPEFGTQSGPMLVISGKLHPEIAADGPTRIIRNGVGVDKAGRAHFVISGEPVSFGRFARYFRDRLKTPNALYLDGNVSALWDPAAGRTDATAPLGPLIVVTNRNKTAP